MRKNYNPKKHLFYCFHGTTKTNANKIVSQKEFVFKERNNHWLGNGVYFFVDDRDKAKWWASKCIKDNNEKVVIETEICVDEDRLLNLDTEKARRDLNDYIHNMMSSVNNKNARIDVGNVEFSKLELRCLCLDVISNINGYQAIKYTFSDDKVNYKYLNGSIEGNITNNGCQLCVRDCDIIDFDKIRVYPAKEA